MSKNNNVNPGQYKVAGRERQGENLGQHRDKQELVKNRESARPSKLSALRGAPARRKPQGRADQ